MPTMKLDIAKRHGKFYFAVWEAGSKAPDMFAGKGYDTLNDVIANLPDSITKNIDSNNEVIFRQIAYSNLADLIYQIRSAQY